MNPLVAAWQDAIDSFSRTVAQIPDADFGRASLLPGWTVGDIVAHTASLELELAGHPLPHHEPDWESLPHANDLFSRYTEVGVDYRRGWTPQQVRAELEEAVAQRREQLQAGPQDDDAMIVGVGGMQRSFGDQVRMRCFDIVVHDLDLRDALGWPEPTLGEGAQVCLEQMTSALGYVWVKKAGAIPGQVLHFVVPGWADIWVEVGEDGRGRPGTPGDATVEVTLPVMAYLRLGSGRQGVVAGDPQLALRLMSGLNVAP
jgi:uncharacterized protein (TIGR03083 family)